MKKISVLLVIVVFIISCVSSNLELYSDMSRSGNKVYIEIDRQPQNIGTYGVGFSIGNSLLYSPSSETIVLGSVRNNQLITEELSSKGYIIVNNPNEADIIVLGESSSDSELSSVILAFYDAENGNLLMICEGKYGLGLGIQDDVNNALVKALEAVPEI